MAKTTKTTVWRSGQSKFVVKCDVTGKVLHGPCNKVSAFSAKKKLDAAAA